MIVVFCPHPATRARLLARRGVVRGKAAQAIRRRLAHHVGVLPAAVTLLAWKSVDRAARTWVWRAALLVKGRGVSAEGGTRGQAIGRCVETLTTGVL